MTDAVGGTVKIADVMLKNLVKQLEEITAVENVNLEIQDKEFVVLVGPSGCGSFAIFYKVALPLSGSGLVAAGILDNLGTGAGGGAAAGYFGIVCAKLHRPGLDLWCNKGVDAPALIILK